MDYNQLMKLVSAVFLISLVSALSLSAEKTYTDFQNGTWKSVDLDTVQGQIRMDLNNFEAPSRWNSRVLDSKRDNTVWRRVYFNSTQNASHEVKARVMTADRFLKFDPLSSNNNTRFTGWKSAPVSFSYLDFRSNYSEMLNPSVRGLDFDADTQSPELWYSMEGLDTKIKDFSSNSRHAEMSTSGLRSSGKSGKALDISSGQHLTLDDTSTITNPAGNMTIEMWVNPSSLGADSETLIDKQNEFRVNLENSGEVWLRTYGDNNRGSGSVPSGTWSHIAFHWSADDKITTYVNGQETSEVIIDDQSPKTSNTVYFGRTYQDNQTYGGKIDELRIFRNTSKPEFLTNITDFTSTAEPSGSDIGPISEEYAQIRYTPDNETAYTVDQARVASGKDYSPWRTDGDFLGDVQNNRYGIVQVNLSTTDFSDSPIVSGLRVQTAAPKNLTPEETPVSGETAARYRDDIALNIDLNQTNYSTTDPLTLDYNLYNLHQYCDFNEATGYCERIDSNLISTSDARLMTNEVPLYESISHSLYGSERTQGQIDFTVPFSYWTTWNTQIEQFYTYESESRRDVSNNLVQPAVIFRETAGGSCDYVTDCQPGLYCADTTGNSEPDTCKEQDASLSGNRCELIGAGAKERVSNSGYCEVSYPDAEERNIPSGNRCEQSADCVTNFCYDGNGNGNKTCQTNPADGASGGQLSGGQSSDADSCYFAGKVYSPGATKDIFSDGIQNQCVNGRWEQKVKAVLNYSDVEEDGQIDIRYNVLNFRDGFSYSNGYVERNNTNDITLQNIRIGISGKTFDKSISGTIGGKRNLSGSVTVDVPDISHTDDLQANTYLEYDRDGNTYTIAATPLFGGDHQQSRLSGACRNGWQVGEGRYCLYGSQEDPYSSGSVVSTSSQTGDLCVKRTSDNVERRVTPSGSCQISGAAAENNNLPNGYVCETKEDCINDFCYDVGGSVKTCQSSPESGTNSGILGSPQSCQDNSCFYEGQCYSEGTSVSGFQLGSTMSCQSGSWGFHDDIAFKMDAPDQELKDTVSVDFEFQNLMDYCDYTGLECRVIEGNVISLKNITFSVKDHEPFTKDISRNISGEGSYSEQLDVNIPGLNYTNSSRMRAVLVYERNDTIKQAATPNIFRGQTWKKKTSGSCLAGYETDKGYFCEFDGADQTNSGTGQVKSSSNDIGDLCKTEGTSSRQRVAPDDSCDLAGPGVENQNVPLGNECEVQADCINNYCYDSDNDTVMSCQDSITDGSETGVKVSDATDCAENSCLVRNQCYADGAKFEFKNQTFTCDKGDAKGLEQGELRDNITPRESSNPEADIQAGIGKLAFGLRPNTTSFESGSKVKFDYFVRNMRRYCSENQNTGMCIRLDNNTVRTKLFRYWFDSSLSYDDETISVYGEERKSGSFTGLVPEATAAYDFRSVLQYNNTFAPGLETVSSRPYMDNQFTRSGVGQSCRYVTDCQDGLYCADTDGDTTPDTCKQNDGAISGNICEYYGSGTKERVNSTGACEFAEPGFENHNIPDGNECRTSEDCLADFCVDSNDDGTKTCETSRTTGSNSGIKAEPGSCGVNSCYYGGECYSSGTTLDINTDSNSSTCENGVWQDKLKFNAEIPYGFEDTDSITIDYDMQNPRECDESGGFCMKDRKKAVELQKIEINVGGRKVSSSISGNILPERNVSGSATFSIPKMYHTDIMDTRLFLHYYDNKTDSNEVITTTPVVRGLTYDNFTSGVCYTGYQIGDGVFCEYDTQENPSSVGAVVDSSSNPGNLCKLSEATATEHRVTTKGSCKPAGQGYENRNLPDGYQCTNEKDCISDYCYDVGGGVKTCQSTPTSGTNSGLLASQQSCSANSCYYQGKCYSDGTETQVFDNSAQCTQGRWSYNENEVGFKGRIKGDISTGETLTLDYSYYNPYQYCDYKFKNCEVIENHTIEAENITIQFRNDNTTVPLSGRIAGGQRYDDTVNFEVPNFNFTDNLPVEARVNLNYTGNFSGTMERRIVSQKTDMVIRGSDWENKTVGSCLGGLDSSTGSFCAFNSRTSVSGTGDVTQSGNVGDICETPQLTTQVERVTPSGECKPAQAGAQNLNQPDGYACQNQADCINDYCYDNDNDTYKSCQSSVSTGSESGVEISESTDCSLNSCLIQDQCYADGATINYRNQTLICDSGNAKGVEEGELRDNISSLDDGAPSSDIFAEQREFAYGVELNTTSFGKSEPVEVNYKVRNMLKFCQEKPSTGLCRRIESNKINVTELRTWFDSSLEYHNSDLSLYGGEKYWRSFVRETPDQQAAYDFRSTLQYNLTSVSRVRDLASRPYMDNQFVRSDAGGSCRYVLDCKQGLYCADSDGDDTPDTCKSNDDSLTGNVCEYFGSGTLERVAVNGSCKFAEPGFENHNIPDGNTCRTTQDCISDFCYDSNDDGTKTCETSRTTGSNSGVKSTKDSCGVNSCYYSGQCYSDGTTLDINIDSGSSTCENGVWQDEIKFNSELWYNYTDGEKAKIEFDVQNPRKCDRSSGFCGKDRSKAIKLNDIVVNSGGYKFNESVSGNILPERNVSGSVEFTLPELYHTEIYDARVFLHYYDNQTGTNEVITARPSIRGETFENKSSGSCYTGYQVADGYFCNYGVQESPSSPGLIQSSGSTPGDLCSFSEPDAGEHRVTTSGTCEPAAQGYENRNLPDGYKCTNEKDCISDYCYDVGGAVKTCQSTPSNGTNSGILGARQSGSAPTCHYAGRVHSEGTQRKVFGKNATCTQGRWSYDSEVGFKAEIPGNFQPGDTVKVNYSMYNPYQYCSYDRNNCTVIEENIAELENMTIEFRNDNKTVDLSERIAGGERVDGNFSITVPDFNFTDNIPITAKTVMNYTSYEGTTERIIASQKTDVVVRGSDWENKTSGQCLGGLDAATGSYCLFNNQTDVNYGEGDVRLTSNAEGQICETPQMSTQVERVTPSGECKPAQAGAQNLNQPDGYACQNQADCINDYCYDKDEDNYKECHPNPSVGQETGVETSERSDCGSNSCWVSGYCYNDGSAVNIGGPSFAKDGFEDSEMSEWNARTQGSSTFVTSSAHSYRGSISAYMDQGGSSTNPEWVRDFEDSNPGQATAAVKVTEYGFYSDVNVRWKNSTGSTAIDLNLDYTTSNGINVNGEVMKSSFNLNQWYYVEMKKIDWSDKQIGEVYLDGNLELTNVSFQTNTDEVSEVTAGIGDDGGTDFYLDEVTGKFSKDTKFCDNGELKDERPSRTITSELGDVISEFRDFTFEVVEKAINSASLDVKFELTSQVSDKVEVEDAYIITETSAEKLIEGPFYLDSGQSKNFSITTDRPLSGVKQVYAEALVTNATSDVDQWVASNTTCYVANWNGFQETCIRDDPQIDEIEFKDYPSSHKYNISIIGTDPDGASDLNSCTIEAEEEDGKKETYNGFIDTGYGMSSEFRCTYDNINESIPGFEPKDYVRHVISVTDTSGKTGTEIERHRVPNRPPTQDQPAINPDPALSGDDLTAVAQSVNDVEGDTVTVEYNWTVDGANLEFGTQTLESGNYSVGDFVTVYVTPSDTYDEGQTKSKEVQIQSAIVNIIDIVFDDYNNYHAFNATAQVNATDPTGVNTCEITLGDGENSYTYSGTVNQSFGENDQVSCHYNNISSAISGFEPTEELDVEFYVEDENAAQDTRLEQNSIPNTPPETDAPSITPSPPTTFDDLQANNGSSSDAENDSISFNFDWYVNKNLQVSDDDQLLADNFTGGDNITLEANPTDGYEFGLGNNTTVQVEEADIVVSNLTFQDYSSREAFNLSADVTAPDASDLNRCDVTADDSDGNLYIYQAILNTSYGDSNDAKCSYSDINSSINGFESGEDITVKVNVTDGTTSAFQERTHQLPDLALDVWNLTFTKVEGEHEFEASSIINATDASNIDSCSFEASDGEGNVTSSTGSLDTAYGDSSQARCTYSSFGVSDTGFEIFENLTINASADSPAEFDSEIGYQIVPNSAPDIREVYTNPRSPIDQNDVELKANVSDDESDGLKWVNFSLKHENGTMLIDNENGTYGDPVWTSPQFSVEPETQYNWTVKTTDPYNSSMLNGSFATVNQPPTVKNIQVTNKTGEHGYEVRWEIEDPDGGSDVSNCVLNASDGEGNTLKGNATIDSGFGSFTEAACTFDSINSTTSGYDVNEEIDFTVNVSDTAGQSESNSSAAIIPNRAPAISLSIPSDGAGVSDPADLGWSSADEDGDTLSHRVVVSSNSDLSSPEVDTVISAESYEASLSQGTYYWQVNSTDGFKTSSSEIRTFDIVRDIQNVKVRMKGDYPNVVVDGVTENEGTYQNMDYPYIAMEGTTYLEGIIGYRGAIESEYSISGGDDVIELKKDFNGERFFIAGFEGDRNDIEEREQSVISNAFLDSSRPSFTGEVDSTSLISAILRYEDIDVVGNDGRITPGSSVELIVRNNGTESGDVVVELRPE